jgi:hypothetical protein
MIPKRAGWKVCLWMNLEDLDDAAISSVEIPGQVGN